MVKPFKKIKPRKTMIKILKINKLIFISLLVLCLSGYAVERVNRPQVVLEKAKSEVEQASWESALPMFQIMNLSF